jgi:hypothetical protein
LLSKIVKPTVCLFICWWLTAFCMVGFATSSAYPGYPFFKYGTSTKFEYIRLCFLVCVFHICCLFVGWTHLFGCKCWWELNDVGPFFLNIILDFGYFEFFKLIFDFLEDGKRWLETCKVYMGSFQKILWWNSSILILILSLFAHNCWKICVYSYIFIFLWLLFTLPFPSNYFKNCDRLILQIFYEWFWGSTDCPFELF